MPGSSKLPNYLRAHRKRLGLSQDDWASLMGCQSGAQCSRYERFEVEPKLEAAFMCGFISAEPLNRLFEGVYERAAERVTRQARTLLKKYQRSEVSPEVREKIKALEAICARTVHSHHS